MKETDTWPLCNPRLYFLHCLCSSHQGMSRGNSWLCKHDSCDGNPVLHHSTDTLNIVCCNSTSPCYIICPFQLVHSVWALQLMKSCLCVAEKFTSYH